MISLIKAFLLDMNLALGKLFYRTHSGFLSCLVDHWHILTRKDVKLTEWTPIVGTVDLCTFLVTEYPEERGGKDGFTRSITYNQIPDALKQIIKKHSSSISNYLGTDFNYELPFAYETSEIPGWAYNYDVYSNVWHMDSNEGMRQLKIFVNLEDVKDDKDGPMFFLNRENSKKLFHKLWHRWTFDNLRKGAPKSFDEEQKFFSAKGGYLILNTANCFHRASSPSGGRTRKMLHIVFYPKWLTNEPENRFSISSVNL